MSCGYEKCKDRDADHIICHGGCGKKIKHSKDSLSIGHTCLDCNVEMGKGE